MKTPAHSTDHSLPTLYPPHDPRTQDGSLADLVRSLAMINARLLAEAQQTEQPTKQAA